MDNSITKWTLRTCSCGQTFIPTYNYVYKLKKGHDNYKYYCSYTCWRNEGGGQQKRYTKREKD